MRLQNQDIWFGYIKLLELSIMDLPIETSAGISQIIEALKEPYKEIETKRLGLLKKYGKKDKKRQQIVVDPLSKNAIKLAAEFGEILIQERDIQFEKVKLPRKVSAICPKCHEVIETSFLINTDTILPLLGTFIDE